MFDFEFVPKLPRRTHCAPERAGRLPEYLPAGAGPVLLVSDRGLARLGLPDGLRAVLERSGRKVSLFTDLAGEPTLADLNACVSQAEADGVGAVVGLGGGSALDTAKATAALLGAGLKAEEAVGADRLAGRATPLVLLPTTAGTGSEATPNALFLDERRQKAAIISPCLLPDVALLDPALTVGLPPTITASTGLDALTHAVESYLSRRANPVSRAFSAEAVRLVAGSLEAAVARGDDLEARAAMLTASYLGGAALTIAGTAAVHALAYSLGSRGVPHGVANGLLLPHVMRFNAPNCQPEFDRLSAVVGGNFLTWVEGLVRRLPVPHSLGELGLTSAEFAAMAEESLAQTRLLQNNPRAWSAEAALAILREAA